MAELDGAFFIERMKDLYGKMAKAEGKVEAVCEQCGEEKSVAFCRQCTEFICEDCVRCHRKMKLFASHEVATLADLKKGGGREILLKEAPLQKCPEHDEVMKIFCFDCDRLVCRDCILYDHREHKSDFVKKCATESRKALCQSFAPLQKIQADIAHAKDAIVLEKCIITSQSEDVCAKMHQSFDELKAILDQRKAELVMQANKLAQSKMDTLTGQVKVLQVAQAEIQSLIELVERNVTNSSDHDLMSIRKQLQAKLEEEEKRHSNLCLTPAATADIVCNPPPLDAIPRELGVVFTSKLASSIAMEPPTESVVGEPTGFFLEVPLEVCCSVQVQLNSLVDPNCIVEGTVGVIDNAHVVTYTPRVRGRHTLVVKVNGIELAGSPFKVFVKIHPTQLGKPVRIMDGFNKPWGIAINSEHQLVVAESGGKVVTVMEKNGKKVQEIRCPKFRAPKGVAVGTDGALYVTDNKAKCLFMLDRNGRLLDTKYFNSPLFVKVINGHVYLSDKLDHAITVMDMKCNILGSIFANTDCRSPKDITERKGDLYVGSDEKKSVCVFECIPKGKLLGQVSDNGGMFCSRGLGFDKSGHLYIVSLEPPSKGVHVYNSCGDCITSFGLKKFGFLQDPAGLIIDNDGFVYVCDYTSEGKVYVF